MSKQPYKSKQNKGKGKSTNAIGWLIPSRIENNATCPQGKNTSKSTILGHCDFRRYLQWEETNKKSWRERRAKILAKKQKRNESPSQSPKPNKETLTTF